MTDIANCPACGAPMDSAAPEGLCRACLLRRGLEPNTVASTAAGRLEDWIPPSPGDLAARFPDFEIRQLLGRGGMGAVYQARQKSLDRLVALKILPPEVGAAADFTERFTREAQALARLNHPHIVTIYDFGQRDGLYFFVMEYMDGPSVRQLINAGRVSSHEALAIVPQVCDALQYAHDHGVVHRDIKPENLLLNRHGNVKIADFGLAKLIGAGAIELEAERVMGTPHYMAPEQRSHPAAVDHRADIYSVGVVFYQLLTGELPTRPLTPPSSKVVIDVRLDEIVLRSLEDDPARRYQQVSAIKTDVELLSSAAQGRPEQGATSTASSLKSSLGFFVTPEYLLTPYGGAWKRQGNGELALFADRLVFTSGSTRTEISFGDLKKLGAARGPRWTSAVGHQFVAIRYGGNAPQTLLFNASPSLFQTGAGSRERTAAWVTAINHAVERKTGKTVPPFAESPAVFPASPWECVRTLAPMIILCAAQIWVFTSRPFLGGNRVPLLSLVWVIPLMASLALFLWFVVLPLWTYYFTKPSPDIDGLSGGRIEPPDTAGGFPTEPRSTRVRNRLAAGTISVIAAANLIAMERLVRPIPNPAAQPRFAQLLKADTNRPRWFDWHTAAARHALVRGRIQPNEELVLLIDTLPAAKEWSSHGIGDHFQVSLDLRRTAAPKESGNWELVVKFQFSQAGGRGSVVDERRIPLQGDLLGTLRFDPQTVAAFRPDGDPQAPPNLILGHLVREDGQQIPVELAVRTRKSP